MSKARHAGTHGPEKLDDEMKPKAYNAQGSKEEKEVDEGMKKGGRAKKKEEKKIEGEHGKRRLDRPGRKRGGGIGADKTPLSTAAKVTDATEHKTNDGDALDD